MNKKQYLKHFLTMFLGTVFAQVFNFIAYPFLTRLYTPVDFGLFSLFLTTSTIMGAISCGRFDVVIQVAKYRDRFAVYRLSQIINCVVAILSMGVAIVFLRLFQHTVDVFSSALLLGMLIFLLGYCNASSYFLLKHEEYKLNAFSMVIRVVFTAIPQIALFYLFPTFLGLVLGLCMGYFCQALLLYCSIRRLIKKQLPLSWKRLRHMLFKYKKYPQLDVPNALLNALSINVLTYCILFLYSPAEVGFYSIAYRLIGLPLSLVSNSLSQVFFQKAAKAYHSGRGFWRELKFNLIISVCSGIVLFSFILFFIKPIIKAYLGEHWLPAASIVICLLPLFFIRFIVLNISTVPLIVGRIRTLLFLNLGSLAGILMSFCLAKILTLTMDQYLYLNSITLSLVYIVFFVSVIRSTLRIQRFQG